jgi:hypothetical protein
MFIFNSKIIQNEHYKVERLAVAEFKKLGVLRLKLTTLSSVLQQLVD